VSSTAAAEHLVIGAGVVGLACAHALQQEGAGAVLVIEAEERVAAHQSGHNSGVIHSGLYYRPGSLKARLCTQGRAELLEFCAQHEVPHQITGKVVVATNQRECQALVELARRGRANGLTGIEHLGPAGIREHEPHA
jgi:L-2-hydroxyglutarate oxidase